MFEIIDCFVTNALTLMVYGVPACVGIAFIHFVVTHPAPMKEDPKRTELKTANLEVCSTIVPVAPLAETITSEPVEPALEAPVLICVPIDWSLWKVQDLRGAAIRKVFGINSRTGGRACRRNELIDQYEKVLCQHSLVPI